MRAILALVAVLPLAGCVAPAGPDVPDGLAVPDDVYRAAYRFAANRVGPVYFANLYEVNRTWTGPAHVMDCDPSSCTPLARLPHWWVKFDLVDARVPGQGGMVSVWPDGAIANFEEDQPYYGFPDCKRRPASCWFLVDEERARAVAERDGLEPRGCPLEVSPGWSADHQRFTWQVSNPSCPSRSEEGQDVQVDLATGRIISRSSWYLIID